MILHVLQLLPTLREAGRRLQAAGGSRGQSALAPPVHAAQLKAGPCMAMQISPPVCKSQAGVKLVLEGVAKNGLAALTRTCGVSTLQEEPC